MFECFIYRIHMLVGAHEDMTEVQKALKFVLSPCTGELELHYTDRHIRANSAWKCPYCHHAYDYPNVMARHLIAYHVQELAEDHGKQLSQPGRPTLGDFVALGHDAGDDAEAIGLAMFFGFPIRK